MAGECSAEQAMVQMIAVRVTTARKLMHEKPEGRSNRQERGPHRSREQVRILKEVGTLKAALISVVKPGQASAAAMQCLAEFGIYHDLQMTPQEAHHVTLCPQWKIVLNAMIQSRQNELQSKAIKQDRWNNREADRQAEKAFLEEHKGPGKFSGKYGPQPTQTELVWRMPWGCWLEYDDDQMLSEAWNAATEEFSQDWPSTAVHQIQGTRIILSVSYDQKDWGVMQEWISQACSTWHSKADPASAAATLPVVEAAVSSTALSDAATGTAAVAANAATAPSGIRAADPSPGAVLHLAEAANASPTLGAEGSSTGAAIASANTAALLPGLSAANFPTGTTFVSAGAEADPSVAGAVSTDATLAPTGAAPAPTGANLAANAAPAAPVTNAAASSKSPSVGGYTAGTLGAMMHDCVKWVFTGQRAMKQAQEWKTVLELAQPKRKDAHHAPS